MEPKILPLVLSCTWALFIALFAVPSIIRVAHLKNILDQPNLRTVHDALTPRLGGLAIFAGFTSSLTIFGDLGNGVQQLLAGCVLIAFIGLKDDLVTVSAMKKFAVQVLATGIVMFIADIRITSFQGILGIGELPALLSYGFTFLAIIGITNSVNLIDGVDGLAGTIVCIITATFGIFFFKYGGASYSNYAAVAFCLIGGVLGFLRYNFRMATIFMGDTGSLLCGFVIAVMAIQFIEMRVPAASPSVAAGILFVPLFDTLRVLFIRLIKRKPPFFPDKNHIHHRLLLMGLSPMGTVATLALLNIAIIIFMTSCWEWGNANLLLSLLFLSVILSVFLGDYKSKSVHSVTKA